MESPHFGYVSDFSSRGAEGSEQPTCVSFGGSWQKIVKGFRVFFNMEYVSSGVSGDTHAGDRSATRGMQGTSMSNPLVAGVCARIAGHNPNLNQDIIKSILKNICVQVPDYDEESHNINSGWGYPDMNKYDEGEIPEPQPEITYSITVNGKKVGTYKCSDHLDINFTCSGDADDGE